MSLMLQLCQARYRVLLHLKEALPRRPPATEAIRGIFQEQKTAMLDWHAAALART